MENERYEVDKPKLPNDSCSCESSCEPGDKWVLEAWDYETDLKAFKCRFCGFVYVS